MRKTLTLDQTKELMIIGVIKDIPSNSDLQYDIFVAAPGIVDPAVGENWGSHYLSTFALLRKDADITDVETKLSAMIQGRLPEEKIALKLQPPTKLHLYAVDGREEGKSPFHAVQVNLDDPAFAATVEALKGHIRAGDVIQIVP